MYRLLLLLTIASAYGCLDSKYTVEDELYSCLEAEYYKQGIDVEPLIDSLENYYISQDVLIDKTGKSKFDFYKEISETGKVPTMEWHKLTDSVGQIMYFENQMNACLNRSAIDSTAINNSVYSELMNNFHSIKEVNPQNAAKAHIEVLTPVDFEHPYYRAHMIISFTRVFDREKAYIRSIPKN